MAKLSKETVLMLDRINSGLPPDYGAASTAEFAGRYRSMKSMQKRGLLGEDGKLTKSGAEALRYYKEEPRPTPRFSKEPGFSVEELRKRISYDPVTGDLTWIIGQCAGQKITRKTHQGYIATNLKKKQVSGHRIAWALHYGYWPNFLIDHADCNKSNNALVNLRKASDWQNAVNKIYAKGTPRGIRINKSGTFTASVARGGNVYRCGTFPTLDMAAHAYNKKAIELFGDFAVLNPIGAD